MLLRSLSTTTMSTSRPASAWLFTQVPTPSPPIARPRTAQSRPGTARPQTAASTRHEGSYVVAVFEGRGVAREVGMAAIDKDTGRVMLIQVSMNRDAKYILSRRVFSSQIVRHT